MNIQPDHTTQVITTGTFSHWVDTPTTVALVFGLAGAVFLGIYAIRRIRNRRPTEKR